MASLSPRAIFFDAVGTLLHPVPSAARVYALIGREFGSRLDPEVIVRRFSDSFRHQEAIDRANGNTTSEAREIDRWRTIVAEVLDDVNDAEGVFQRLYAHFADPASWQLAPDTGAVLTDLASAGILLGMASNFDRRLYTVAAGFPELRPLRHIVVSAAVGHRKPSPAFFAELSRRTGLAPREILLVGDDPLNDVAGAEAAGMQAWAFDGRADEMARLRDACLD